MGRPPKNRAAAEQKIAVTEAPIKRDLAHIPEELQRFFAATGKRVSLASWDPIAVAKHSQNSRFPIRLKDLGEREEDLTDLLTGENGFHIRNGNFCKGDCYLYQQSMAAFEDQLNEGREINEQQYGEAGFLTDLGVIDDLVRKSTQNTGRVDPKYSEIRQMGQLAQPT
jgi:hypothetical protein